MTMIHLYYYLFQQHYNCYLNSKKKNFIYQAIFFNFFVFPLKNLNDIYYFQSKFIFFQNWNCSNFLLNFNLIFYKKSLLYTIQLNLSNYSNSVDHFFLKNIIIVYNLYLHYWLVIQELAEIISINLFKNFYFNLNQFFNIFRMKM